MRWTPYEIDEEFEENPNPYQMGMKHIILTKIHTEMAMNSRMENL